MHYENLSNSVSAVCDLFEGIEKFLAGTHGRVFLDLTLFHKNGFDIRQKPSRASIHLLGLNCCSLSSCHRATGRGRLAPIEGLLITYTKVASFCVPIVSTKTN